MKKCLLSVVLACALCTGSGVHAQAIVIDPTNLIQNALTAIRTLEQVNNQIRQLQNEAQMLANQARNLARLDFTVIEQLRSALATTQRLIAEAEGLAYDVQNLDHQFRILYPEEYAEAISGDQMFQDARERWKYAREGLHTAMRMQAQISALVQDDQEVLTDLVQRSQSAEGALQTLQANNQLLALQAKQAIQGQQLQLTQARAVSLELARQVAATERAREVRRRFIGEGTPYTPHPVRFYGD